MEYSLSFNKLAQFYNPWRVNSFHKGCIIFFSTLNIHFPNVQIPRVQPCSGFDFRANDDDDIFMVIFHI